MALHKYKYNYISVRDQVFIAKQNNKCDYKFELNDAKKHLDGKKWEIKCSDPCKIGWCELFFHITFSNQLPRQIKIYYVKKAPIAYISFIPSVLDFLIQQKILDPKKLEIVDEDLLPKVLQGKSTINL
jgi:hypothetical protein